MKDGVALGTLRFETICTGTIGMMDMKDTTYTMDIIDTRRPS